MYRVSYIALDLGGPRIVSVAHPTLGVAQTLYDALRLAGVHVRLWDKDGQLLRPDKAKEST